MKNKNLCIIQTRMASTRLPGKVMLKVKGQALLTYEIRRVRQAKKIDKIVVATTTNKKDGRIYDFCRKNSIDCFRGSENDVLDRYYLASAKYPKYGNIIRITGDCPLIDPQVIDDVVDFFEKNRFDYASNVGKPTYPDGMDVEIFKRKILEEAAQKAKLASEREHVTLYIRNKMKIKKGNLASPVDFSHFRLTVDNQDDFEVIKFIIENSNIKDGYPQYISLLTKNPEIMFKNMHIKRNEG